MRKYKKLAGKAVAILMGGCILQLGGCSLGSLGGLGGLVAAPLLLQTFGGLFGTGN